MARAKSQQDKRRIVTMFDQHGRPWTTGVENETGDPCGVLVARFNAPWYPAQNYVGLDPRNPSRLRIAYEQMEADYREAYEAWERRVRDEARKLPGVDAQEAVESPPQMLLDIVGPPPPSILIPRAGIRGSRWLLGFTSEKPRWAVPLFPDVLTNPDRAFEGDEDDFDDVDDGDFQLGDEDAPVSARERRSGAAQAVPGRTTRVSRQRPRPSKARGAERLEPITPDGESGEEGEGEEGMDEGELVGAGAKNAHATESAARRGRGAGAVRLTGGDDAGDGEEDED